MVVAALAAALAACSAIKLAYATFDEYAFWWLDSYVDFSDDQEPRVREDLRRLHLWHRSEELPRIAGLLRRIEDAAPANVTAEQVCSYWPQLRDRVQAVIDRAEPAAVTLAFDMGEPQFANLRRKYEKNNANYRRDWVDEPREKVVEKRAEQFADRAETVYGSLSRAQRAIIEEHVGRSVFDPRRTLAERQRRQQDAIQTLRKIAGQRIALSEARALVHAYMERAQVSPDAAYRQYQETLVAENCRLIAQLHNSTTPAQREQAVKKLRGWQRDLRELSAQP